MENAIDLTLSDDDASINPCILTHYASSSDDSDMDDEVEVTACQPEVCLSDFDALSLRNTEQKISTTMLSTSLMTGVLCPEVKPKKIVAPEGKGYKGIKYKGCTYNDKGARKGGAQGSYRQYNCMKNRGGTSACTHKLYVFENGDRVERGEHGQNCYLAGVPIEELQEDAAKRGEIIDYSSEMGERAKILAEEDTRVKPAEIWRIIADEMHAKHESWKGLSEQQVQDKVRNTRKELGGSPAEIFEKLEDPKYKKVSNSYYFYTYSQFLFTIFTHHVLSIFCHER